MLEDAHPKSIHSRFNTVAQQARHAANGSPDMDLPSAYRLHVKYEIQHGADPLRAVFNYWTDIQRFLGVKLCEADFHTDILAQEAVGEDKPPVPWRTHKHYENMVNTFSREDCAVEKPLTKERLAELNILANQIGGVSA